MRSRSFLLGGLLAVALALAGCGGGPRPGSTTPQTGYKVGNPYQINGTWYYPAEDWAYDETGIASWYGEDFHGKYTANGEVFNLNAVTAAHRTLPMPSVVQVTNLENGRSIQVRVNDRGPFARGRIIDLSRRSAQLLGFEGRGTAKVRVKILVPESIQAASLAGRSGTEVAAVPPKAAPVDKVAAENLPTPPGVVVASNQPTPMRPPAPPARQVVSDVAPASDKVTVVPVKATQIFIQAGAFANMDRAWALKARLDQFGKITITDVRVNGAVFYRVRLGPVASVEQADALLEKVATASPDARIVIN